MFSHHLLFSSREATSETYGPRISFHHICLCDPFSFAFIFRFIKPKIQKYIFALYLFCDLFILSITTLSRLLANSRHRYPKGIDNPFNTSSCENLLFVCRCCLRCVAWFSYWFDNLDFISEGNTYHRCAASSHPLWGGNRRSYKRHQKELLTPLLGRIFNITRFLITNHISSQFTLFAVCLSFSSPPLHKKLPFYSPLFFRSPFSCRICF